MPSAAALPVSEHLVQPVNDAHKGQHVCCRWRSLEGNDPGAYELIMKCQASQRRLIQSIELCVEKDTRIAELEGLRDELKAILARQPGAESALVISDLQVYIASLHHPSSNLEGASSESPMSQSIFVRSGAYWEWYLFHSCSNICQFAGRQDIPSNIISADILTHMMSSALPGRYAHGAIC